MLQSASTKLPLSKTTLDDRLKALLHSAKLKHFHITSHSFRGGAATSALNAGISQVSVMQAGRWKTTRSFQRYINLSPIPLPTHQDS